jgi:hypothetical protein
MLLPDVELKGIPVDLILALSVKVLESSLAVLKLERNLDLCDSKTWFHFGQS